MAQDWAKWFYRSKAWLTVAKQKRLLEHYACERCRKPANLVHHKTYLTPDNIYDPNISLNLNQLELLCDECHNWEHAGKCSKDESLRFDSDGNLIYIPPTEN